MFMKHVFDTKKGLKILQLKIIMTENLFLNKQYYCTQCNKGYNSNSGLWKHNLYHHNGIITRISVDDKTCKYCKIAFNSVTTRWRHEKSCNKMTPYEKDKIKKPETTPHTADLVKKVAQMEQEIKSLQDTINTKPSKLLIETESDEEENLITNPDYFVFNNLKLYPNKQTGYIDITLIATIPDKLFNTWITQESTLNTITGISQQTGIQVSQLIIEEKTQTQLHPDLAIEFIKWLSPVNGIKFAQWVGREKAPANLTITVNTHNQTTLPSQFKPISPNTIPDNVVYIITSPVHRKLRTYIIGKAQNIKSRLSNYNKSMEHEVVYYVQCHTSQIAHLVESMVLTRLHKYREVVNRDRFVLPTDTPLTLFTDVLDEAVGFFSSLFESDNQDQLNQTK